MNTNTQKYTAENFAADVLAIRTDSDKASGKVIKLASHIAAMLPTTVTDTSGNAHLSATLMQHGR